MQAIRILYLLVPVLHSCSVLHVALLAAGRSTVRAARGCDTIMIERSSGCCMPAPPPPLRHRLHRATPPLTALSRARGSTGRSHLHHGAPERHQVPMPAAVASGAGKENQAPDSGQGANASKPANSEKRSHEDSHAHSDGIGPGDEAAGVAEVGWKLPCACTVLKGEYSA